MAKKNYRSYSTTKKRKEEEKGKRKRRGSVGEGRKGEGWISETNRCFSDLRGISRAFQALKD